MKFFYKTKFGTFFIFPDNDNGFHLWIKDIDGNEEKLGYYHTASMAADDVYHCATGYDEWDLQIDVDEPSDLEEWTKFQ